MYMLTGTCLLNVMCGLISATSSPAWGLPNYLPERPEGEDDHSMVFMKEWLSSEVMKSNVRSEQVRLRMDKTLSERRKYIVEVKPRVVIIQQEWPWLFRDTKVNTICSNLLCYKLLFTCLFIPYRKSLWIWKV